jgi:hypothetical protein
MLVGLIWRENAKTKRSLTTWRNKNKEVLPTSVVSFRPASEKPEDAAYYMRSETPMSIDRAQSLGFGRQAEKAAAAKGMSSKFSSRCSCS